MCVYTVYSWGWIGGGEKNSSAAENVMIPRRQKQIQSLIFSLSRRPCAALFSSRKSLPSYFLFSLSLFFRVLFFSLCLLWRCAPLLVDKRWWYDGGVYYRSITTTPDSLLLPPPLPLSPCLLSCILFQLVNQWLHSTRLLLASPLKLKT